ncbi:hypothetical protein ACFW0H_01110 [Pseudomonas sp. CR3202]|uniref:hypothetical protein n=1 Tax=Pseudomonas sp. CR3202 TaxID=3351532 RepID=UPI003BF08009
MMGNVKDSAAMSPRYFLPEGEVPPGFFYPKDYIDFVESNKPYPVAMIGMPPWIFAGDLVWAKNESAVEFGTLLVPFAQAENMDMVAYFEASGAGELNVLVANPWEVLPQNRVYERFGSFNEWLSFAKKISSEVLEEKPQMKQRKFWFPNA